MARKRVLVLAANTRDEQYLNLQSETDQIRSIAKKKNVEVCQNTTTERLYRYLTQDRLPHVIHFCGHGMADGLLLVAKDGNAHKVDATALSDLFENSRQRGVQCVFLNTCYSEPIADAISQHVDFVIGMSQGVPDSVAIHFSTAFYRSLVKGKSYVDSYREGCKRIAIECKDSANIPRIKAGNARHIAEEITIIQQQYLRATTAMDFRDLLYRLTTLRLQDPDHRETQKLAANIRRTARLTRTPRGILLFFTTADTFSVAVLVVWIGLGTVFSALNQATYLPTASNQLAICFCLVGSYMTQVIYQLSWYSLRPVGTWAQAIRHSLLPDVVNTIMRSAVSVVAWLVLIETVSTRFRNRAHSLDSMFQHGLIIGLPVGMVMVVLMLWQISLAPSRK